MLKRLLIKNLVLVESCEIHFQEGFNVLTGETGAGKSIILSSLSLLLGQRQDSSLIRQGALTAIVEASFEADSVTDILQEAGILHEPDEELRIRRELSPTGKSRTFVNDQAVGLQLLKKLGTHLLEITSQHGHIELLQDDAPLLLVDRFAGLSELKAQFQKAHSHHQSLQKAIAQFHQEEAARSRSIETSRRQIEEIEKAKLKAGEDEEIFSHYSKLAIEADCAESIQEIVSTLEHGMPAISRLKGPIDRLFQKHSDYSELSETFKGALSALQELSFDLSRKLEASQEAHSTFLELEERLKLLHDLKKKYGPTLDEVILWKEKQQKLLFDLESKEHSLEELEKEECLAKAEADRLALKLTEARKKAGKSLGKLLTEQLVQLNMPHAVMDVVMQKCERTSQGDEQIEFYLTPNRGEAAVNIQKGISGGELARVALAFKCVMIDQDRVGTILFDEIDANIGGETASIVGQKLAELGKVCQVIAVTHFAQVATFAHAHFRIHKAEDKARTTSHIQILQTHEERKDEITRMLGGKLLEIPLVGQIA